MSDRVLERILDDRARALAAEERSLLSRLQVAMARLEHVENDQTTPTGLEGYLRTRGIDSLTMAGLATDFCVHFSAVDAARLGFGVTVRMEACRAIDLDGSLAAAVEAMKGAGVALA